MLQLEYIKINLQNGGFGVTLFKKIRLFVYSVLFIQLNLFAQQKNVLVQKDVFTEKKSIEHIEDNLYKMRASLINEEMKAYIMLMDQYGVSKERQKILFKTYKLIREKTSEWLQKADPNVYRNPHIPKELIYRIEKAAALYGIHPKSISVDIISDTYQENAEKKAYGLASIGGGLKIHNFFGWHFKFDVNCMKILLSKKLLNDFKIKKDDPYYFSMIQKTIYHELTHLLRADGWFLWLIMFMIKNVWKLKPYDEDKLQKIERYCNKIYERNANLIPLTYCSIMAYEMWYCLKRSVKGSLSKDKDDSKHFCWAMSAKWACEIMKLYEGLSIETLMPEIEKLKAEQRKRLI